MPLHILWFLSPEMASERSHPWQDDHTRWTAVRRRQPLCKVNSEMQKSGERLMLKIPSRNALGMEKCSAMINILFNMVSTLKILPHWEILDQASRPANHGCSCDVERAVRIKMAERKHQRDSDRHVWPSVRPRFRWGICCEPKIVWNLQNTIRSCTWLLLWYI